MLLDRKRVKFWQKWVFGFMAIIMAGFLIMIPLSSRVAGCSGTPSAVKQLDQEIARYQSQTSTDPTNATAWINLAENLALRANQEPLGSVAQQADLSAAATHYLTAAKLLSRQKGAAARQQRLDTLDQLVSVYVGLKDYQNASAVLGRIAALRPKDPNAFYGWASAAIQAGDKNTALLAFAKFLQLDPTSPDAAAVKQWIQANTASPSASVSPSASPSPSPSSTGARP